MSLNLAEASLDELYGECATLRREFADLPEGQRSDEDNATLVALTSRVEALDHQITLATLAQRREDATLASHAGGLASDLDTRSLGDLLVTDEMAKFCLSGRGGSGDAPFRMDFEGEGSLAQMLTRAYNEFGSSGPGSTQSINAVDPSGAGYLLPAGQPIAPVPRHARLFLRDLLPSMTTTLAALPYVQELNPTGSGESASAVAEGGTKPGANISFQAAKADPTVIAATLVISKQLFEDSAAVVQYINQRLPYIVKFKEDWEFLNGSGTWPDIGGILNQSGVLSQGFSADNATTFGKAFAKVENEDGTPTAVVLNPTNAWNMFTNRAAGGSGTFDAGTPFSALPLTVWGVPTYRTRAMAVNTALVGDFQMGGMIADREQVNVETYRERYAELNQILMVCEERVGLMVFRPDLFVSVSGLL